MKNKTSDSLNIPLRYAIKYKNYIEELAAIEFDSQIVIIGFPFYGYTQMFSDLRMLMGEYNADLVMWKVLSRKRKMMKEARKQYEEFPIGLNGLKDIINECINRD